MIPSTPTNPSVPNTLKRLAATCSIFALACAHAAQKTPPVSPASTASVMPGATIGPDSANPDIVTMVSHLELEKYKSTIKGLTQFGDRRQGTDRNRAAVDWIEAQLKSYGCTPTERITYQYVPPAPRPRPVAGGGGWYWYLMRSVLVQP
jgi:hypothetical protein